MERRPSGSNLPNDDATLQCDRLLPLVGTSRSPTPIVCGDNDAGGVGGALIRGHEISQQIVVGFVVPPSIGPSNPTKDSSVTHMQRPKTRTGCACVTPTDAKIIALLGGKRQDNVVFTIDQVRSLERFYGFDLRKAAQEATTYAEAQHAKDVETHQASLEDPDVSPWLKRDKKPPEPPQSDLIANFMVSGSERNLFRAAQTDGLRVMAFLSKFLERDEDPVKLLVQLMDGAGIDVGDHIEWATEEDDNGLARPVCSRGA